jgi:putative nucleotidyltransferase with HDIG domain
MKGKVIVLIIILMLLTISDVSLAESKVTVGYPEHYPLTYKDNAGEASGFFIDLLKKIDERNETITFDYIYGDWENILNDLESGKIDLVAGLVEGDERLEIYDFNKQSMVLSWGTVVLQSKKNVESILDLEGMTLGHLRSDYFALGEKGLINKLYDFQLDVAYKSYPSYNALLQAIEDGAIEGGIMDQASARKIYNYKNIKDTGLVFAANALKVAALKGNQKETLNLIDSELQQWLEDKDSFYYEAYNRHLDIGFVEGMVPFYRQYKKRIWFIFFSIALMVAYSQLELYLRTKELRRQTKVLEEANEKSEETFSKKQEIVAEKALAVDDLQNHIDQFEDLMLFITRNVSLNHTNSEKELFSELLEEAFRLIEVADFGYVYNFDENQYLKIVDTINVEISLTEKIHLRDLMPIGTSVAIIEDFTSKATKYIEKEHIKNEIKEQFKPSKESLLLVFKNNQVNYGGIVLDIKEGSRKRFDEQSKEIMLALKNIAEGYFLNENYYEMDVIFQKEMIFSLIKVLEIHDAYTKGHSQGVAREAKALAQYMSLPTEAVNEVYWAGLVHDVGKILISEKIINKKTQLTSFEYETIKKHPVYGYEALKNSELTKDMADIVLYHHERYDGKGYPEGIRGQSIPYQSRIISIVDSYDAMISDRVYKPKKTISEALFEIEKNLSTQFDPEIGRQFIEMKKKEVEIHEETNHERYCKKSWGV